MIYIIFIVSIAFLDLISKHIIKNKFSVNYKKEIIKNKFYIWHIKNKGAAYSKLEKYPNLVFASSAVLFSIVLLYFNSIIKYKGQKTLKMGLSMIIGGAIGNIVERAANREVTDFIYLKSKNAPIFNIADIFIFIGSLVSMLSSVFCKK